MGIVGLIGLFLLIFILDLPLILGEKSKGRLWIPYTIFFVTGFVLGILLWIDRPPVSPTEVIRIIVQAIKPG